MSFFKKKQNCGPGEGGGFLGLDGPRVPAAEPRHAARAAGLPDGQGSGPAEPPGQHAAGAQETHLRQRRRETGG